MMRTTSTITLVDNNGNDDDDVASTTKTKPIIIDLRNICQIFLKHSYGVYVNIFAWNFTRLFSVNFESTRYSAKSSWL